MDLFFCNFTKAYCRTMDFVFRQFFRFTRDRQRKMTQFREIKIEIGEKNFCEIVGCINFFIMKSFFDYLECYHLFASLPANSPKKEKKYYCLKVISNGIRIFYTLNSGIICIFPRYTGIPIYRNSSLFFLYTVVFRAVFQRYTRKSGIIFNGMPFYYSF